MRALIALAVFAAAPAWQPREVRWAKERDQHEVLRDRVYPLGFSKGGAFAYLLEPADEACGCYFASFVVVDLKHDAVLEDVAYVSDQPERAPFAIHGPPPTDLLGFWRAGETLWRKKLATHGIELGAHALEPAAQLRLTVRTAPETIDTRGTVPGYTLRRAAKIIAQRTLTDPTRLLDAQLAGLIRSPFAPLGAVLIIETVSGWEGPPHVEHPRFFGVILD
jgi:hypothetical protein